MCWNLTKINYSQGRCDGSCSGTCTFDGRKYETLSGIANQLAVVIEDNFMCYNNDPYHHRDNILVHEFAHVIDMKGFNQQERNMVR